MYSRDNYSRPHYLMDGKRIIKLMNDLVYCYLVNFAVFSQTTIQQEE